MLNENVGNTFLVWFVLKKVGLIWYDCAKDLLPSIIDFAGYDNGVQFEGGTAENYPLTLGSGQFVPGFEDQLVGAKVGEQRDVNIKFPDNYVPELAGHEVVFKVTVKEIQSK